MSIATKTGDSGETSLFFGTRVSKSDLRVESYGSIDELNAALGVCRAHETQEDYKKFLLEVQKLNFVIGAELATPIEKLSRLKQQVSVAELKTLELKIEELEQNPEILKTWTIPGEDPVSSWYDMARCVCRRVERNIVRLNQEIELNPVILKYINRLSDWLWLVSAQRVLDMRKIKG